MCLSVFLFSSVCVCVCMCVSIHLSVFLRHLNTHLKTYVCMFIQEGNVLEEEELVRRIPDWAIAVIIVLNFVVMISVLLLVLCVVGRRYSRYVCMISTIA